MGKSKKSKEDKEKELLEMRLLRIQIVESATNTIFAAVSIMIAVATAIIEFLK